MKKNITLLLSMVFIFMLFVPNAAYANKKTIVYTGTKVPLVTEQLYTSKEAESGIKIVAKVQSDVQVGGVVVFKEGAIASINISDVKSAGFCGNPGYIAVYNGMVQDINGINRPVEIVQKFVGEERTYPKVLCCMGILFIPLLLFGFVKGGQGKVMPGKVINSVVISEFSV